MNLTNKKIWIFLIILLILAILSTLYLSKVFYWNSISNERNKYKEILNNKTVIINNYKEEVIEDSIEISTINAVLKNKKEKIKELKERINDEKDYTNSIIFNIDTNYTRSYFFTKRFLKKFSPYGYNN